MADKSFGVKRLNLIGASGVPTIESPNNLNLNAISVGISTDLTIGGKVESDVIVGSSYSVGIGTTNPITKLHVEGGGYFSGIVTASIFSGSISTAAFATTAFSLVGIAETASFATTAFNLTDAANILSGTINPSRLTGEYNIDITGNAYESNFADTLRNAANILTGIIERPRLSGDYDINITGTAQSAVTVAGGIGSLTNLYVSGVSTLGTVKISSGIVTAVTGVVTYYGDGSGLTGVIAAGFGVTVAQSGSPLGIGVSLNFQNDFQLTRNSAGIVTITVDKNSVNYFKTTATGIHTLGNVGIGTTNATSKLTVDGDLKVTGNIIADLGVSQTNQINLIPTPTDTTTFPLFVSSSTTGIGTSVFTDSTIYWDAVNDILNLPTLQPSLGIVLNDNSYIDFGTSNDVRYFYDGANNDFEIQLNTSATKVAITDNGTYKHIFAKTGDATIGNVKVTTVGSGATVGGSIGVVTYYGDGQYLQNISIGASAVGSDGQIQYNNGGNFGGASQFYYDDFNNRVGIGTTTPTQKLHVEGNVYISGTLTASNTIVGSADTANRLALISTPSDTTTYPLFAADATGNQSVFADTDITWDATNNRLAASNIRANTQFELQDSNNLIFGTGSDAKLFYDGTGNILNVRLESSANSVIITDAGTTKITLSKGGTVTATDFNSTSDINLKTNIQEIESPLDKIIQIRGVSFEWKENHKKSVGVVAQEIETIFPELVSDGDIKTVNYNGLIGLLIESVKELREEIEQLKKKINN